MGPIGSDEQIFGVDEQVLRRGRPYIGLHNKAKREGLSSTFPIRLSLILRRLEEIERKLDRMLEELRMPTAIGYSVRRGNLPRKD